MFQPKTDFRQKLTFQPLLKILVTLAEIPQNDVRKFLGRDQQQRLQVFFSDRSHVPTFTAQRAGSKERMSNNNTSIDARQFVLCDRRSKGVVRCRGGNFYQEHRHVANKTHSFSQNATNFSRKKPSPADLGLSKRAKVTVEAGGSSFYWLNCFANPNIRK